MEKDKKYRRIGWITSALTQVVLLVLFYFLVAWREPFPPIPSFGIELSFGLEDEGRGSEPLSAVEPQEESADELTEAEESVEQVDPNETDSEEITETPDDTAPLEIPTVEQPSADVSKPAEEMKPAQEASAKAVEPKKQTADPRAEMPPAETSNENRGDTPEEGAQGKEEGSLDGRALMGEQGAGEGASLQMTGWIWDTKPQPKDDSSESGKIVYQIKVDDEGFVVGVELISSTVSPLVERQYRQSIERLTFSKTSSYSPAPFSTGTVTFIIRSR